MEQDVDTSGSAEAPDQVQTSTTQGNESYPNHDEKPRSYSIVFDNVNQKVCQGKNYEWFSLSKYQDFKG